MRFCAVLPLVTFFLTLTTVAAADTCVVRQELTARAAAIVSRYVVANGQKVAAGELIVEFDDRMIKAAMHEAEAAVDGARANVALVQDGVARLKKLRAGETVSQQSLVETQLKLAQAQALQKQAEAALERVRVQYEDTKIKAEISGTLRGLPSVIGLGVQPGQSLGRVEADPGACRDAQGEKK